MVKKKRVDIQEPLTSVVIPCYNLGQYLAEAIESVRRQTYQNYEILVIDDGSDDPDTVKVLSELKIENPDIIFFSQKNKGASAARNTGIKKSKGQYILCLDADDKIHPQYLEKTLNVFQSSTSNKLGIVSPWIEQFGTRTGTIKTGTYDPASLLVSNVINGASLFRKDAWEKAGGYKEEMTGYEDWEFWISIVEIGYTWESLPAPLFYYRIREQSKLAEDSTKHLELYNKIVRLHPKIFRKYLFEFAKNSAVEIKNLRNVIYEKERVIEHLNERAAFLAEQSIKVQQYEDLLRSRIMKVGERLVGLSLQIRRLSPVVKTRLKDMLAFLLPKSVKRLWKHYRHKRNVRRTVYIDNEKWPSNKPLVSIVTPFYNSSNTIQETIKSVQNQTFKNFEYIIVDDGSKLDHAQILDKCLTSEIKLIRMSDNIGQGSPAAARNEGIRASSGKYIVCLDADDVIDPTYIEKCAVYLETHPNIGFVTTNLKMFGESTQVIKFPEFNPKELLKHNSVITAAMFRREAWERVGGYKSAIGYEDWEFWINIVSHGYFGKRLDEELFNYRTAEQSRFVEDKKRHDKNIASIRSLHPEYRQGVAKHTKLYRKQIRRASAKTAFVNMGYKNHSDISSSKKNILIFIPWMTFGGAETLLLNYCIDIKDDFNISFITGLDSDNEWEDRFKRITPNIFHLAKLLEDSELIVEFISNFIRTRNIQVLHIVHNSALFNYLPEIRRRHPDLGVVVTIFNDLAEHFHNSLLQKNYIDAFTSDNRRLVQRFIQEGVDRKKTKLIPNGVNTATLYNPDLYFRDGERAKLGLNGKQLAVFFVGRLSEEKNPDVFLAVANSILKKHPDGIKFFLIGDGPMRKSVEAHLKESSNPNVIYLGYQSDVARLLSAADVLVLPSKTEGFPTTVLEAMAMKICVIASDVGAVTEVINNETEGFVVRPGSVLQIEEALTKVINDRDLLRKIKLESRKKVEERFSTRILVKNYSELYRDLK